MSTETAVLASTHCAARRWFTEHLSELQRHCRGYVARLPRREREEAAAEVLACSFNYALQAEQRGVLGRLTPFTLVAFLARGYCAGRRLTGTSARDVLSFTVQRHHRIRVVSLDQPDPRSCGMRGHSIRLSDALPDPKAERPDENTRRNLDYPMMLRCERASRNVRRVFRFLVATLGTGRGKDLARELRVSPPRVCQLKDQLGRILAMHGYGRCRALQSRRPTRLPGRLRVIPLNAGTSPESIRDRTQLRLVVPPADRASRSDADRECPTWSGWS